MRPKILVTREVFDETLAFLAQHCEVESNQQDVPFDPTTLARRLADKDALMCALTDRVDAALLAAARALKVVANIAVGYNNIDVAACSGARHHGDEYARACSTTRPPISRGH